MSELTEAKIQEMICNGTLCKLYCTGCLRGPQSKENAERCKEAYQRFLDGELVKVFNVVVQGANVPKMIPIEGGHGTYMCDPTLNIECKKTWCYENGGDCYSTTDVKYAKLTPEVSCSIKQPEPEEHCYEKTREGEFMHAEGETIIVPKDEYRQLVFNAHLVDCLEELGVDNWNGYGDAYKNAEERMELFDNPNVDSEDIVDLPDDYWEEDK